MTKKDSASIPAGNAELQAEQSDGGSASQNQEGIGFSRSVFCKVSQRGRRDKVHHGICQELFLILHRTILVT